MKTCQSPLPAAHIVMFWFPFSLHFPLCSLMRNWAHHSLRSIVHPVSVFFFLFVLSQCISLCASCGTGEPASACQLSLNYLNSIQGRFQEVFILCSFARERWPPTSLLLKPVDIPTVTQITKRWLVLISSKNYFSFFFIVVELYTHM